MTYSTNELAGFYLMGILFKVETRMLKKNSFGNSSMEKDSDFLLTLSDSVVDIEYSKQGCCNDMQH